MCIVLRDQTKWACPTVLWGCNLFLQTLKGKLSPRGTKLQACVTSHKSEDPEFSLSCRVVIDFLDVPTLLYSPDGSMFDTDVFYPSVPSFVCGKFKSYCDGDRLPFSVRSVLHQLTQAGWGSVILVQVFQFPWPNPMLCSAGCKICLGARRTRKGQKQRI